MFRAYMIDFSVHNDQFVLLEDFLYNNNYHSSIGMYPLIIWEEMYVYQWLVWCILGDTLGYQSFEGILEKVKFIELKLLEAKSMQISR